MKNSFRLISLLLGLALLLGACGQPATPTSVPASPTPTPSPTAAVEPELYLNIVWHQHQPFYAVDPATGLVSAPWVRFHAAKDYVDMVTILENYPKIHVTFNLTPSLLSQIQAFNNGQRDIVWAMTLVPADQLTEAQKTYILQRFFDINGKILDKFPRFQELSQKRGGADSASIATAVKTWTPQDFLDLQVLFNLAWTDPGFLAQEPLASLVAKGSSFTEADKQTVLNKQAELVAQVIPVHKQYQDSGQIEITFTPYAHPILPLLIDTNLARVAVPNIDLPTQEFTHGEDAVQQVERGVALYKSLFGQAPRGMWPAEGAVAQLMVGMTARAGVQWMVTDEGILSHSLNLDFTRQADGLPANAEALYRPYTAQSGSDAVTIFFRDSVLSNKVSFDYSKMSSAEAVNDFITRLRSIRDEVKKEAGEPPVVTVILDGENAWEWYDNDGKDFLNGLYTELSNDPTIKTVTPSEFLKIYNQKPEVIPELWAGSWDNATFETWIGEPEENQAWDYLGTVRTMLNEYMVGAKKDTLPADKVEAAYEAMLAAEGSDWFWWYGTDKDSGNDAAFDAGFRETLGQVYDALGLSRPAFLSVPIILPVPLQPNTALKGLVEGITIDGAMTTRSEWMESGKFFFDSDSPSTLGFALSKTSLYLALYQPPAGNYSLYLKVPSVSDGSPFADENGQALGFNATHRIQVQSTAAGQTAVFQKWNSSAKNWETIDDGNFAFASREMAEVAVPLESLSSALDTGDSILVRYADEAGLQPAAAPGRIQLPDLGNTTWVVTANDPANDDHGPGTYTYPTDGVFKKGVFDLLKFQVGYDKYNLVFRFEMNGPVENPWGAPNGLSIQVVDIYINTGTSANPMMRNGRNTAVEGGWDYALSVGGWNYGFFTAADPEKASTSVPVTIITDPGNNRITAKIPLNSLPGDPKTWAYAVAVLSNDGYGINGVRDVNAVGGQWAVGGADANPNHTRIIDYLWPEGATPTQEEMLSTYAPDFPQVKLYRPQ